MDRKVQTQTVSKLSRVHYFIYKDAKFLILQKHHGFRRPYLPATP